MEPSTSGPIVVKNETSADNVYYTINGVAKELEPLHSGVLGPNDKTSPISVSGYFAYEVTFNLGGPFDNAISIGGFGLGSAETTVALAVTVGE